MAVLGLSPALPKQPVGSSSLTGAAVPIHGGRHSLFRPGWPLAAIFVPFPLWWVAGLTEWAPLAFCGVMALHLVRHRRVEVPRGFGWWLLFLMWICAGVAVINVPAYAAIADNSSTRIITFGYRLLWYVAVTVAGLYLLNTRRDIGTVRIVRIVGLMFIWVVCGGILGLLAPRLEFSSLMELVLPQSVDSVAFIHHMIHPSASQVMDVLGYEAPRPSAPFSYTNTWGVNLAVTAPFFVLAWFGKDAGWRRAFAPWISALAIVAVIYSINRGLWVALAAGALFLAIRSAFLGRPVMLFGVVIAGLVVVAIIVFTPLGTVVQDRFANEGSIQGRTNLSTTSVESVVRTSPIVGLGSTRNVQGNFNSIAGGATELCPRCSPPALGTQGQLWLVIFSQGVVGLVLYLGFFAQFFLRNIRSHSPVTVMGLTVIVVSTVTMPVYNSLGTALLVVFVAVSVMAREAAPAPQRIPYVRSLGRYAAAIRERWLFITALAVLGAVGGLIWQLSNAVPVRATYAVVVPLDRTNYPVDVTGPMTIDTLAQLVDTPPVTQAVAAATSPLGPGEARGISLTATPNSRVLHVTYQADREADARAGARTAAAALVAERRKALAAQRAQTIDALEAGIASNGSTLTLMAQTLNRLSTGAHPVALEQLGLLRKQLEDLRATAHARTKDVIRISSLPANAGAVLREEPLRIRNSAWIVSVLSGLMLGLLAGLLVAMALTAAGGRVGRRALGVRDAGIPLAGVVRRRDLATSHSEWTQARTPLVVDAPWARPGGGRVAAVVVADHRARTHRALQAAAVARAHGKDVVGVVVVH